MEEKPERIWIVGDSETILACREKQAGFSGEYFGNRLGEIWDIQGNLETLTKIGDVGEWWHVKSEHNAADSPTHLDTIPQDIWMDSPWQNGPEYLTRPREEWPF